MDLDKIFTVTSTAHPGNPIKEINMEPNPTRIRELEEALTVAIKELRQRGVKYGLEEMEKALTKSALPQKATNQGEE